MKKILTIFTVLALLGGCAAYTLVDANRHGIGGTYSVETGIQWSKITVDKIEAWTVDGPALETLRFFRGIENGDKLFAAPEDKKLPIYRTAMSASDVMEFVVDSFSRTGASNIKATGLRPALFGAAPGFRFDLVFTSEDGLWFDAMATGATIDGKLHLIIYSGTQQYYFPKYREEVERIFNSIQTT